MRADQRIDKSDAGFGMAWQAFQGLSKRLDRQIMAAQPQIDRLAHRIPGAKVGGIEPRGFDQHLEAALVLIRAQVDCGENLGRIATWAQLPGSLEHLPRRPGLLE